MMAVLQYLAGLGTVVAFVGRCAVVCSRRFMKYYRRSLGG